MGGLCQVPKIMYTISYAFNIALLIVFIAITTTEWLLSVYVCFPGMRMLQNLRLCILLEGFTNFSVDPYYDHGHDTPERVWYPCYYTTEGYHTSDWGYNLFIAHTNKSKLVSICIQQMHYLM